MSDLDRFAEFVRREAAFYHRPPPTPAEAMWPEIARELRRAPEVSAAAGGRPGDESVPGADPSSGGDPRAAADRLSADDSLSADDPLTAARAVYHEPPETPRDPMWERIEAALALRRTLPPELRDAGLEGLEAETSGEAARSEADVCEKPRGQPMIARWVAGLAIAASLVIGVFLGRGTAPVRTDPTRVAARLSSTSTESDDRGSVDASSVDASSDEAGPGDAGSSVGEASSDGTFRDAASGRQGTTNGDLLESRGIERLETDIRVAAAEPGAASPRADRGDAGASRGETLDGSSAGRRAVDRDRRSAVAREATNLYLGRTETLLTAFRTRGGGSHDLTDLARWARELLGETRLLLDMPVERPPAERALLRDIELILAQMARLSPEAPDFEREVIEDGLQRLGTVSRVRDAMPQVGT